VVNENFFDDMCSRFKTIPACGRQTDRQTYRERERDREREREILSNKQTSNFSVVLALSVVN